MHNFPLIYVIFIIILVFYFNSNGKNILDNKPALFVVGILVLLMITDYLKKNKKENFNSLGTYYKRYCPGCSYLTRRDCSSCSNCGYCITAGGHGECVPGDQNGPYFKKDCLYYEYTNPYYVYPYYYTMPYYSNYYNRWKRNNYHRGHGYKHRRN
jgi:hypothetical protein